MRTVQPAQVTWAILHRVTPGITGLELSHRDLPLTPELRQFLANHIRNGLADSGVRAARFRSETAGTVADACRAIANGPANMRISASRALAAALHTAMGSDGRIKPGAFVIAVHRALNDHSEQIALIKLDPGPGFRVSTVTDSEGQEYLTVDLVRNALPSTKEKLQKCAFVDPGPSAPAGLFVLDRQVDAASADFFLSGFLAADLVNTNAILTDKLVRVLANSYNELARDHPPLAERFRESRDGLLTVEAVDLDQWLEGIGTVEREVVERRWGKHEPDRQFAIDHDALRRRKLIRYLGDHGLQLAVDPMHEREMIRIEQVAGAEPTLWRITIETHRWEQKP